MDVLSKKVASDIADTYESIKMTIVEKWKVFKEKFEKIKNEISQEVINAKSPEDLIALGKRLQKQGKALKLESDIVKQEEMENDLIEPLEEVGEGEGLELQEEILEENEFFNEVETIEKTVNTSKKIKKPLTQIGENVSSGEKLINVSEENDVELSIENEPLGPIMQKYQKNIEDLISQARQFKAQADELRKSGKNKEATNFEIEANKKSAEIFKGGGDTYDESFIEILHKQQEPGEPYEEFSNKRSAPIKEYREALKDSPQMILRIANEAGRLDWQNLSKRLLRNKKFIEAISKTEVAKNDPHFQAALKDNLFKNYTE